jgi:hypothetical protein
MVEAMIEGAIVALIVGAVGFIAGRSLYRTLTGKAPACRGCGTDGCIARLDGVKGVCSSEILPVKREGGT